MQSPTRCTRSTHETLKRRQSPHYDDAFSLVPAASGLRTIVSLVTELNMFTNHVYISQALYKVNYYPGTATMETSIFYLH